MIGLFWNSYKLLSNYLAKMFTCITLFNPNKSASKMNSQRHRTVKYLSRPPQLVSGRAKPQPRSLRLVNPALTSILCWASLLPCASGKWLWPRLCWPSVAMWSCRQKRSLGIRKHRLELLWTSLGNLPKSSETHFLHLWNNKNNYACLSETL